MSFAPLDAVPPSTSILGRLDLTTPSAPMYDGSLEGQGWAQLATSVALWGVAPMVAGWVRIERSEIG